MSGRVVLAGAGTIAIAVMGMIAAGSAHAADPALSKTAKASLPRTADGHPDLQGVWTNATITPLERPEKFGERRALTAQEAREQEMAEADYNDSANAPSDLTKDAAATCRSGSGPTCGYNNFWIDRGHQVATVNGEKRSSLIVEPANGKIPPYTDAARPLMASRGAALRNGGGYDGPEQRPLGERCLLAFGSSSGPPMLPVLYNNNYQIVQTGDTVTILVEMVHDVRVVRLGGQHLPANVRKWMGDSVGRWEGDTLVVETTNFTKQQNFRGASENLKITERFTRVAPDTMVYRFTIDDRSVFTTAWSGEIPMHSTDAKIYEYACHEGNYALPGILAGAREQEKTAAAAAAPTSLK